MNIGIGGSVSVRVVFGKPSSYWLSEKPREEGYWGFVRSRADYESEKARVEKEIDEILMGLGGMYGFRRLPSIEVENEDDVMRNFNDLRQTDIAIYLPIGPQNTRRMLSAIASAARFVVVYDKFGENIYFGTLFSPPAMVVEGEGLRNVVLAEGDVKTLKSALRVFYALVKASRARLVVVGGPAVPYDQAFEPWAAMKRAQGILGFTPIYYTNDDFTRDFNKYLSDPAMVEKAKKIIDDFVSKATRVVEPTQDKLLRAAIYYLVLEDYRRVNDADWVTVNCLGPLIRMVQATPCLSHSIMNDQGFVASCEADPVGMVAHFLLRHIAGKPAMFFDPTVNVGDNTVILAHCTSPTRVLGFDKQSPYEVRTHHESNLSATPKVDYPQGDVTVLGFSFDFRRMMFFKGYSLGTPKPELRICRDQVVVKVNNAAKILENWQGFHWAMVYGDYTRELRILARVLGVEAIELS